MNQAVLLIAASAVLLFAVVFYYLFRVVSALRKRDQETENRTSQMGFVVDTFHDLVTRLKEKERELEVLRQKAEDKAFEIETYNENVLQSVPSGVICFDGALKVTKMNLAAERILGLTAAEAVGKPHYEIFGAPVTDLVSRQESVERAEFGYTVRGGKRIWLGLNMSPLRAGADVVIGKLLVFTDLTELKALQSRKELRERLSTLGEMSAGIAHELRNPMAVISGYTKILSRKIDPSAHAAVEAIAKEVLVMDRIIGDFLAFAKPSDLVLSDVHLPELISTCLSACEDAMGAIRLENAAESLPIIRADEVLLRQAFTNILRNAVEAMPEGGELKIAGNVDDGISIVFRDSGHGVPENVRDKIFLPFFTTKEKGTGLGLSIVHNIVVSHGGTVQLESDETGTAFVVRFPKDIAVSSAKAG